MEKDLFKAACAAMQGILTGYYSKHKLDIKINKIQMEVIVNNSILLAEELLKSCHK
jgi:hypothetical protein